MQKEKVIYDVWLALTFPIGVVHQWRCLFVLE